VDSKHPGFNRILVTNDTVEGIIVPRLAILDLIDVQSKLNLSEEASLHDSEARSGLKLGLFSYPVLQAADILLYK
jgi:tryptophanyl-tRNA synthetase